MVSGGGHLCVARGLLAARLIPDSLSNLLLGPCLAGPPATKAGNCLAGCAPVACSHPLPTPPQGRPLTENLHSPPTSSPRSKQVGSRPSSRQLRMAARPLTPAPTMATRFPMSPVGSPDSVSSSPTAENSVFHHSLA